MSKFSGQNKVDLHYGVMRDMYISRYLDQKMFRLSRQNKGAALQLSAEGHELLGVMVAKHLKPGKDWACPYYRDQPFAVTWGCDSVDLIATFLCREAKHHSMGRMMPGHYSHKKLNMPAQSSVVGSQYLQAAGLAKALKISGKKEIVYVSGGDGSTSQGDFHEALNYASIHKLPVLFVVQDNGWAISVRASEQTSGASVAEMAGGYSSLLVKEADGCNYKEMQKVCEETVAHVRKGKGPALIVGHVPRLGPHSNSDNDKSYKNGTDFLEDKKRDPIPLMEAFLEKEGIATKTELEKLSKECFQHVEDASLEAEKVPFPKEETVLDNLFLEDTKTQFSNDTDDEGEEIVMIDALNHAIIEEMEKDPKVVCFGQDVAHGKGGVFGVTRGLTEKFGVDRCFNTPLAESTIVGTTIGLSLSGSVIPVAEVQFADYLWTGINQLFNELSSFCYRSNGEWNCPAVLRMPTGAYIQGGPYHSQNIEGFLSHCPGLKIVYPSNAADAKALLKTAIKDPNPVIFLEHKALYRQRKFCARKEPSKDCYLPFGKAKIVKEGQDASIICWGMMVIFAKELADKLEREEGVSVEVIDLRTIIPWDKDAVLASVKKTGRILILHEAQETSGFGAEIAAHVASDAFLHLDAPVMRHCGKDIPMPYAKVLENAALPSPKSVEEALRSLLDF